MCRSSQRGRDQIELQTNKLLLLHNFTSNNTNHRQGQTCKAEKHSLSHPRQDLSHPRSTYNQLPLLCNTLRIAHLRIGYLVGNPEVGNPDPYQSSGLPTSIITLYKRCPCSIWPFGMCWGHVLCILPQYFDKGHFRAVTRRQNIQNFILVWKTRSGIHI